MGMPGGMEWIIVLMIIGYVAITVMFLVSQSSFVKVMATNIEHKNTSTVWIWTQLIPIWSLVAIPVTLIKINKQFETFINENEIQESNPSLKFYSSTWGWIWYGGSLVSLIISPFALVALIGVIGFWIHINSVKKSLIKFKN